MPIFGWIRDALGLHKERNTSIVRKVNTKAVLIGVVAAIVVTASTVLWLVKDASGKRILEGKVIDASTNKAIRGAKVYLENPEGPSEIVVTDSEGVFSIDVKEETDTVRFLVRAEGFRRYNGVSRVSPGTTLIEIRLKPI
ncbi:MAG TPA: carboxypeptidase regulatory-like domain-containing protein [Blastocatellia bacterium]|nr:carboxypeptidase regulatory-like domain-containing protein [Blastocatellia bacterium]